MNKAELKELSVDEPVDAARNPNAMEAEDYAGLVEVIRQQQKCPQPLLLRGENLEIIDGHNRRRACREVGLATVLCILIYGVTDAEAELMRISMSKLRGRPDLAMVATIFGDLLDNGTEPDTLKLSGFSTGDIDNLLAAARDTSSDVMPEAMEGTNNKTDDSDKPLFVLEIPFKNRKDYQRARKGLRQAANDGELSTGLLRLLAEES